MFDFEKDEVGSIASGGGGVVEMGETARSRGAPRLPVRPW